MRRITEVCYRFWHEFRQYKCLRKNCHIYSSFDMLQIRECMIYEEEEGWAFCIFTLQITWNFRYYTIAKIHKSVYRSVIWDSWHHPWTIHIYTVPKGLFLVSSLDHKRTKLKISKKHNHNMQYAKVKQMINPSAMADSSITNHLPTLTVGKSLLGVNA